GGRFIRRCYTVPTLLADVVTLTNRRKLSAHRIHNMPVDLAIHDWPLAYESRLDERPRSAIDLIVIHCTELPDLDTAREYGERELYDSGTGNSGHFYIDRDGSVHRFVRIERIANHTRGYNPRSIGIELVNIGRYPHWYDSRYQAMSEAYSEAQLVALQALLERLREEVPTMTHIAGHEDLDTDTVEASDRPTIKVSRKLDPGPLFP